MKIRLAATTCHLLSTGCFMVGYYPVTKQVILWILLMFSLSWLILLKQSRLWSASLYLLFQILLVVVGMLIGCSSLLMLTACSAALIAWDLILFGNDPTTKKGQSRDKSREKVHFQALILALAMGTPAAIVSLEIHMHLPFIVIGALMLVVAFAFYVSLRKIF